MVNVVLKVIEGIVKMMLILIKNGIENGGLWVKLGYLFLKLVFKKIVKLMGMLIYGGVVLLGFKVLVVKIYGLVDVLVVENMIV